MTSAVTRRLVAAVVVTPLVIGQLLTACSPAGPDESTRVLLMGDSITQGKDGDWTWRYRLWRGLQAAGVRDVDFVGPADDLHRSSRGYQDPLFDRDHASLWGTRLSERAYPPAALGHVYRPDVVVVELGVNDIRHGAAPVEVQDSMRRLVEELRAAAPGVDVVVAHVPVLTVDGAVELNRLYDDLADELDDPDERVVVARTDEGFVADPALPAADSYDGLHPSVSGEIKIAAAVADALAELGIGAEA